MDVHAHIAALKRQLAAVQTALRRKADVEAALLESEELRRIAVEGGGMGTWRLNMRDDYITGDAMFMGLWGFPPSDEPRRLSDFTGRMSQQGQAVIGEMLSRGIAAGEQFDGQLEVVSGPTCGRWIRWRGRVEQERPWIVNGVSFDVTEQQLADDRPHGQSDLGCGHPKLRRDLGMGQPPRKQLQDQTRRNGKPDMLRRQIKHQETSVIAGTAKE